MEGPATPAGALGRGEDAGAGQDDRAHGPDRGRAGREAPDHGDRPPKKTLSPGEVRQVAWEVAAELSPAAVKALVKAATGPEGRVVRQLPAASERLVCRTLKANRNALRYRPRLNATEREIRAAVVKLSNCYPTQGHRKILSHVRALGLHVGLRQVRRIRRKHGLEGEAPKAGVRRRGRTTSTHLGEATRPNQVWAWDFVMLRTRKGRALRVLFIIDEYTKRIVASYMAPSIKQEDVARVLLEAMIREEARPENIRSDNGSEFIAETVQEFMAANGIKAITIEPGCPWQNGVIESYNSCFRDECLNGEQLYTLSEARVVISDWIAVYNEERPHGGVGYLTPNEAAGGPGPPARVLDTKTL